MSDQKEILLRWIDEDRESLVEFLSHFIQAKSPNPPGDTREAAAHICQFLDKNQLPYQVISPHSERPNVVGSFECGMPGRHLVLNGHIDVFPVGDEKWAYGPWSGAVVEGHIHGRGACDMKCGTTASIFTFAYLHRIRNRLKGRLTLTAVSDEETFGPWGARHLMENHPIVQGDCLLNAEPCSSYVIRFGEKGLVWLAFTVHTRGSHGASTHLSDSAIKIACRLITDLETVTSIGVSVPDNVMRALNEGKEAIDKALGQGASEIVQKLTLNAGLIRGGLKVNMIPDQCTVETDIRFPVGVEKDRVMSEVEKILARYPQVSFKELNHAPPSWCDPHGEMVGYLQANVMVLKGFKPRPIISLSGTDARLWRYRNVPAYVYGPDLHNVGSKDEYIQVEEFLHIVRTHVLSAYDYLNHG